MPAKGFNTTYQRYITPEEASIFKREDVLKRNKIKYWRKNFKFFIIEKDDYVDFSKISRNAKKIYEHLEFFKTHKKGKLPKTDEQMEFFNKNYKLIKFCEPHLHYIKTIKINPAYISA